MIKSLLPAGCIVVGVDGSEHAERAVTWAAAQAALEGRILALVRCTDQMVLRETAWFDTPGIDHRELTQAFSAGGRTLLTNAREQARLASPGVTVSSDLFDSDPRDTLVVLSENAHLLVLGSRGLGPLRTALLGSVSAYVARHAHCPVVICRPSDHSPSKGSRVVVGADGTEASRPVLEFAFAQASLHGIPLTVMHCFWDVAVATRGPGVVPPADDTADLSRLLAESLAGLAEKFPDVEVTQELALGMVDECLADHTPEAALLVVGRASATGWSRFLHTSCALAVLERARTTVAVVPETNEERKQT